MKRDQSGRFRGQRQSSYTQPSQENCRRTSLAASLGSLIGGAALGAVATYLLDPDQGADRRAALGKTAHRAYDSTAEALRSAYEKTAHGMGSAFSAVGEKASQVGAAAYDSLPDSDDVRKTGRRFFNRARGAAEDAGDTASSWFDSARSWLPNRSMALERHSDYAMNPGAVSATAASTLLLGAGAMWLFDPERGRGRRAWIGQKAVHFLNEIGDFARATGRHLRNKTRGYYHETASAVSSAADYVRPSRAAEQSEATPASYTPDFPPQM
jgi:gas vesicle protein